jgi:hypothetical protein
MLRAIKIRPTFRLPKASVRRTYATVQDGRLGDNTVAVSPLNPDTYIPYRTCFKIRILDLQGELTLAGLERMEDNVGPLTRSGVVIANVQLLYTLARRCPTEVSFSATEPQTSCETFLSGSIALSRPLKKSCMAICTTLMKRISGGEHPT